MVHDNGDNGVFTCPACMAVTFRPYACFVGVVGVLVALSVLAYFAPPVVTPWMAVIATMLVVVETVAYFLARAHLSSGLIPREPMPSAARSGSRFKTAFLLQRRRFTVARASIDSTDSQFKGC
jgi:hypothetical protein